MSCENVLDGSFFNRCRMEEDPGFWTVLANFVWSLIHPLTVELYAFVILLALPAVFKPFFRIRSQSNEEEKKLFSRFKYLRINLLTFLHCVGLGQIWGVALYTVFRQHRPCKCPDASGKLVQVGSIYGLPSGDSATSAMVGAFLIQKGPVWPLMSRIGGILLIILVPVERMALGKHSLLQVTVGSMFGMMYHLWTRNVPQFVLCVDFVFELFLGFLFLRLDNGNYSFSTNDENNLYWWFFRGVAFELFVQLLLLRHYVKHVPFKRFFFSIESGERSMNEELRKNRGGCGCDLSDLNDGVSSVASKGRINADLEDSSANDASAGAVRGGSNENHNQLESATKATKDVENDDDDIIEEGIDEEVGLLSQQSPSSQSTKCCFCSCSTFVSGSVSSVLDLKFTGFAFTVFLAAYAFAASIQVKNWM